MTEKEELFKRWEYEFKEWMGTLQSAPVRLVVSKDESQSYEMERFHVFELEDGQFATVYESGCSCYDPSWARISLYPSSAEALEKLDEWQKNVIRY